jgi:hypothetical protein
MHFCYILIKSTLAYGEVIVSVFSDKIKAHEECGRLNSMYAKKPYSGIPYIVEEWEVE